MREPEKTRKSSRRPKQQVERNEDQIGQQAERNKNHRSRLREKKAKKQVAERNENQSKAQQAIEDRDRVLIAAPKEP
jgi:hypothetical protein